MKLTGKALAAIFLGLSAAVGALWYALAVVDGWMQ